jgi:hypothetical protein
MRPAATLAFILLLGCSSEATIVGEWRYDRDRLATLAMVTEANPTPGGSLGAAFVDDDDSERARLLRAAEHEAETTSIHISKAHIHIKNDEGNEPLAYRVVKRAGDDWLLVVEEDGVDIPLTATLSGQRLTIVDKHDRIRYVLVRK